MRLFTAICFEEDVKTALSSAANCAKTLADGNFTERENFHLTLVFIGETKRLADTENALSKIDFPAFDFVIKGTGNFEKGIFWAGVEENPNLQKLYEKIREELSAIGMETEEREYVPHITLARKFRKPENTDLSAVEELLPKGKQRAKRISLMKSERIDGVLRYTEISSKKLF